MKNKKSKNKTLFEGIRKKVAPSSIRMKNKKKVEKADVVGRKNKHKKSEQDS